MKRLRILTFGFGDNPRYPERHFDGSNPGNSSHELTSSMAFGKGFHTADGHKNAMDNADKVKERQPHSKIPFAERLRWCLEWVHDTPSMTMHVGIIDTNDGLLIRSSALAHFLGIKANSLNKNLRDHGFNRRQPSNETQKVFDPSLASELQHWSLWTNCFVLFSRNTPDDVVKQVSDHAVMTRRGACSPFLSRGLLPSVLEARLGEWCNRRLNAQ
jgi:hypothetical protein